MMSYVFDVRWIVIAFYVVLFGMVVWAIRSSIRDRRAKRRPYLRRNAEQVIGPDRNNTFIFQLLIRIHPTVMVGT